MAKKNADGPRTPRVSTMKTLFARCGNQCAFPGCTIPAYDPDRGTVTVEVCHIEGEREGALRYRKEQSNEDRHGRDNLILLCGTHHKEIDAPANESRFTPKALRKMRKTHEAQAAASSLSDEQLYDLAGDLLVNYTVIIHSLVLSQNQLGGQTAGTIVNQTPPPWLLSDAARSRMVAVLSALPPSVCQLVGTQSAEAQALFEQLEGVLSAAGWEVKGSTALGRAPAGIQFAMAGEPGEPLPLSESRVIECLLAGGLIEGPPTIHPDERYKDLYVYIGRRP